MENAVETHKNRLKSFFVDIGRKMDSAVEAHENGLRSFFATLRQVVECAKYDQEKLDRIAATRFSVFDYFHERETDLSRIFAKLLDPRGTHGQGDRFLRLFLNEIFSADVSDIHSGLSGLLSSDIRGTKVDPEYQINDGRIDIVLQMPNHVWIGIENKPWAKDDTNQVKKYLEFLRQKSQENGNVTWWILYLSGDGSPPAQTSLPDDTPDRQRCVTVPYRKAGSPSIENWAQKCWRECEAERVRWFLGDLLEYIRRSFSSADTSRI